MEGPVYVAQSLVSKAVRSQFLKYFPNPETVKKQKDAKNPFAQTTNWFGEGNEIDLLNDHADTEFTARLKTIEGLEELVDAYHPNLMTAEKLFMMEFALHGMAEFSLISKQSLDTGIQFKDLLDNLFDPNKLNFDDEEDEDDDNFGSDRY
jgi:magnesium chelatase subunit I